MWRAGAAALLLGGCAFSPQLAQVAVDHNRMVAQSTDELTLLNIVRASHRFPLHFTAITTIEGDVSVEAGAELAVALDPRADPQASGFSTGISTNPSYSASVLASEKFQRGIQTPLERSLVTYYLSEGWRDSLLMALMIESVEVVPPGGGQTRLIDNDPAAGSEFAQLLCTHELALVAGATSAPRVLAPLNQLLTSAMAAPAAGSPGSQLEQLTLLLGLLGNPQVETEENNLQLRAPSPSYGLEIRQLDNPRCSVANPAVVAGPIPANAQLIPRFRSTLGVIYFVGEYRRMNSELANSAYPITICEPDCSAAGRKIEQRPLIAIRQGEGPALLATEFEGDRYFIERSELDPNDAGRARSMQVLTLIEQLINLKKSADELPSALNIRTR